MVLNEELGINSNPYPIEKKLRGFSSSKNNSFTLGILNCCRVA
jgi:hypothetical protein